MCFYGSIHGFVHMYVFVRTHMLICIQDHTCLYACTAMCQVVNVSYDCWYAYNAVYLFVC